MRRSTGARRRTRIGFSLLELLVVLAVIGIFTGLVLPKLRYALALYDLERAARQFAADLQVAQTEAWRRNRSVQVEYLGPTSYRVIVTSTTNELSRRTLDGGSAFTTASTWQTASVLRFRPFGPPVFPGSATSLVVTMQNTSAGPTLSRTIRIAQGGAVTVS